VGDDLWAAIDAQRLRVADLLDSLSGDDWDHPSLCEGWTVRDVAAHLTLQQLRLRDVLWTVVRHPGTVGGLNRTIRESARVRAEWPTERLIAEIRATVGSRRHNVGVTPAETLIDILVHGLDIAIPLGRDIETPQTAAALAASRVLRFRGRGKARVFATVPLAGYRFRATDTDWSVGSGPEVEGPIGALLLLVTGRAVALRQLSGPGIDDLRRTVGA
jgi:uncharacterized protein (TIGR03083 family)